MIHEGEGIINRFRVTFSITLSILAKYFPYFKLVYVITIVILTMDH